MNKSAYLFAATTLAVGLGGGYWIAGEQAATPTPGQPHVASASQERKVLFWRNPMNPAITSPVFMKDDMGMDYLPVYEEGTPAAVAVAGTVRIDPVTMQNIGVRTVVAERRPLAHLIQVPGRVEVDESRISHVHSKSEGWIEQMFVHNTGDPVAKNSMLLSIYSPKLVSSQQEYLLALNNYKALAANPYADIGQGARELKDSARERLTLLDVPEHQLRELEQTGRIKKSLHIHSPFNGVITQIGAREGQFVTPETELFTLADLSRVWVTVDVYENDLPWVRQGNRAEVTGAALPGSILTGKVDYIYPYFDQQTRTVKVRLVLDNRQRQLKPGMFVNVALRTDPRGPEVLVPSEAVVRSGIGAQVFVEREPGRFEPRDVTVGLTAEGFSQIIRGIREGERVVASAQFLIDSESKLREAVTRMSDPVRKPVMPAAGKPAAPATDREMPGKNPETKESGHDHAHH